MPTNPQSGKGAATERAVPEPALLFVLQRQRYAIAASHVSGLADCSPIRKVHGGPRPVLGLTEWRGNLLTVVDLGYLLGHTADAGPHCLLRLAPPLELTAFRLPATVRIVPVDAVRCITGSGEVRGADETRPIRWIDPTELVGCIEMETPEHR